MGCHWICAPLWSSMGCRGTAASTWFAPGTAGEPALTPGAPPLPPCLVTLVSAELFLQYLLTPFSHSCCTGDFTLSEIRFHRGSSMIADGFRSDKLRVPLEISSVGHTGSSQCHSTEAMA